MTQPRRATCAVILASVLTGWSAGASGQATPASAAIPQPHLALARQIAAEENGWKHTALITCYPEEGQAAQKIIKDPAPARAFDNLYFLGNGIVASWAFDTPDGIVLIDAMNDRAEVDKYIIGGLKALGVDPARIKIIPSRTDTAIIMAARNIYRKLSARKSTCRAPTTTWQLTPTAVTSVLCLAST